MKKLMLMVLMGFMLTASAVDTNDVAYAGFGDLTTQEQAEIVKLVADKKAKAVALEAVPVLTSVDEAQKWVNLGSSIGKGLASSAKEVGMAVEEFSTTSVGQLTMFLIVFHIIGDTILHVAASGLLLIFGLIFTTVVLNRRHRWTYNYDKDSGKLVKKERGDLDGDVAALFWFAYLAVIAISALLLVVA